MVARDAHRAKTFYEAVLRLPFSSSHPGAWRTGQTRPPLGMWSPEGAEPGVQLSYRVERRPPGSAHPQPPGELRVGIDRSDGLAQSLERIGHREPSSPS